MRALFDTLVQRTLLAPGGSIIARAKNKAAIMGRFDGNWDSLNMRHMPMIVSLLHGLSHGHPIKVVIANSLPFRQSQYSGKLYRSQLEKILFNYTTHFDPDAASTSYSIQENYSWHGQRSLIDYLSQEGRVNRLEDIMSVPEFGKRNKEFRLTYNDLMQHLLYHVDWKYVNAPFAVEFSDYDSECSYAKKQSPNLQSLTLNPFFINENAMKKSNEEEKVDNEVCEDELDDEGRRSEPPRLYCSLSLDPAVESPYTFYQYFVRIEDNQIDDQMRQLSFADEDRLVELQNESETVPWVRQKALGQEMTLLVHGVEGLDSALRCTNALFKDDADLNKLSEKELLDVCAPMPSFDITFDSSMTVKQLAMRIEAFNSETLAEKRITAGGFYINQIRRDDPSSSISETDFLNMGRYTLIRRGKRSFYLVKWQ